jgi:hypothetical protein
MFSVPASQATAWPWLYKERNDAQPVQEHDPWTLNPRIPDFGQGCIGQETDSYWDK